MNVSLTPELEQWVQSKVETGLYSSSSEVIRDALRTLHQFEDQKLKRIEALKSEIQIGMEQLKSGDAQEFTPALLSKIKKEGRARRNG
ncbi:MAG: type II toxin-antitoxin system ParD family antitoxin [Coraliomargarita sp.]